MIDLNAFGFTMLPSLSTLDIRRSAPMKNPWQYFTTSIETNNEIGINVFKSIKYDNEVKIAWTGPETFS